MNNMGSIYQDMGDVFGRANDLVVSEKFYREALTVYSREKAPTLWSQTQNNLGVTLSMLGEGTRDEASLAAAIAAFEAALLERIPENSVMDSAASRDGLGYAMALRGQMKRSRQMIEQGRAEIVRAQQLLAGQGYDDYFQSRLAAVDRMKR